MKSSLLFVLIFFLSCDKKSNCIPYSEAVNQGIVKYKTTTFNLKEGVKYKLDYVIDGTYDDSIPYCYGRLELKRDQFKKLLFEIAPDYKPDNIISMTLFGQGKDICNNKEYQSEDIKNYIVYYIDANNNVYLDYVGSKTGNRDVETYPISNIYSTVKLYYLMKSEIVNNPSMTDVINIGFENNHYKFIPKENDTLYLKIHNRL